MLREIADGTVIVFIAEQKYSAGKRHANGIGSDL